VGEVEGIKAYKAGKKKWSSLITFEIEFSIKISIIRFKI
jgi:hypothetical protein